MSTAGAVQLAPVSELQRLLPLLTESRGRVGGALLEHCAYYGIDFAARVPGVVHYCGVVPSGEYRLATHVYRRPSPRGTLLLVHGYFDHCGLYRHLIAYGLDRGWDVVTFDLPGHGLSTGEPAAINDFGDYAAAVADIVETCQLGGDDTIVMAQSTGCAALIEFARHHSWPFQKAVFLAPLLRPTNWPTVLRLHGLLHRWRSSVPRIFNRNTGDDGFLAFQREDRLQSQQLPLCWVGALRDWLAGLEFTPLAVQSLLIVQGDEDTTVDWRYNLPRLAELFPNRRQAIIKGARHQLANETEELRSMYLRLVDDYLGGSA